MFYFASDVRITELSAYALFGRSILALVNIFSRLTWTGFVLVSLFPPAVA